ncbi:hypothetical protein Lalb_Chr06g0164241 [Lupinus albus]|uniref:Uncharacterized protein n=1 Tax=Lupinus albus TaxID=3870 RepID=A0A6A4QDN8_LUPAL|nr:hypothetical protein Lalb_Chr06g0164241 [Lupinus albus]
MQSSITTLSCSVHTKRKKENSNKVLFLDLNLTPLENDMQIFKIRQTIPLLGSFI